MDLGSLRRNIATAWRYSDGAVNAYAYLSFLYSPSLPKLFAKREFVIGFRYPEPVGIVRLLLRVNAGSDAFIHSEVFHHEYYDLDLSAAPQTILDLGANIGLTSIYLQRRFPRAALACVEPMPDNLRVLHANLRLNNVNATVFPGAVDCEDGRLSMEVALKDYGHRVARESGLQGKHSEVPAFSVPTLLSRLGWSRVGLLKVDIEGHERILFSRNVGWMELVDSMCIECHDDFGVHDLQQLAEEFGFLPPQQRPGIWLMRRRNLV